MNIDVPLILWGIAIIFGLGLFIMIHEFGHLIAAKLSNIKVTDYFIGFGPKIFSFKRGETTYGVAAIPLGGYVKMSGNPLTDEEDDEDDERGLKNASFIKKVFVVISGPLLNIITAIIILAIAFSFMKSIPTNIVQNTEKSKPAHGIIKPNDKIIAINGKRVNNWEGLSKEIQKYPNQKIKVTLIRKGEIKNYYIKITTRNKKGFLGVAPKIVTKYEYVGVVTGAKTSVQQTIFIIRATNNLFFKALSGKPKELIRNAATPVGIVVIGAKYIENIKDFLLLLGLISVSLGYINLLPIPPLDGGHLVVYLVEKIKGSPIRKKLLIAINIAGLALILTFFIDIVFKEITKGFSGV